MTIGGKAQGRVIFVFVQKSTSELGLPRSTIHVHTITTRGTINPAPHWLLAWPHASQKIIEKYRKNRFFFCYLGLVGYLDILIFFGYLDIWPR